MFVDNIVLFTKNITLVTQPLLLRPINHYTATVCVNHSVIHKNKTVIPRPLLPCPIIHFNASFHVWYRVIHEKHHFGAPTITPPPYYPQYYNYLWIINYYTPKTPLSWPAHSYTVLSATILPVFLYIIVSCKKNITFLSHPLLHRPIIHYSPILVL